MILEQELGSWVGKIGVGIGVHFLRVGNTLIHSTVQLPAISPASVDFQKFGTDEQKNKRTEVFVELLRN